jgi:ketosteroid isomerase-like protein
MSATDEIKTTIRDAFRFWESGDHGPFFDLIAEDVNWTVIGTAPVSGTFR